MTRLHEVISPPEGYDDIGVGMSNHEFTVDAGVEERLLTEEVWTTYTGWNFCGYVWHKDDSFWCQVWVYGSPRETMRAPTLEALMHAVSAEYGYD